MNITEDYCSYEVAKLLKEKGFNDDDVYFVPTHQMAMKWLRETHGIDIIIEISDLSVKDRKYYCMIWDENNNSHILELFNSYEESVEAALKYSLENLI